MAQLLIPRDLQHLDRSTYKLTQLAKRVAIPRNITGTDWGPVAETCRDEMGIEFDGWQDGMGQLMMARSTEEPLGPETRGMLAHTVGGMHISGPRQFGKTFWGSGSLFGLCQHYPDLLVIWTAHHSATSDETFEAMQGFAETRRIKPFISKILTGSGHESVHFHNGSRIMFGARERGFGRGIPGVDVLFFDEAQILSERALQALVATLNTSWLGLHIHAGTPPPSEEIHKAQHWMRARDEAWAIKDSEIISVETDDLVWVEFGADDDADLDDVRQWARNPSVPHRTPFHSIQRLRRNLNDEGFRREGLGLYDESDGSIFDLKQWERCADENAAEFSSAAMVIDVGPDRKWSSIALAGAYEPTNLDTYAEIDEGEIDERALVIVMSLEGTRDVVARVDALIAERDIVNVAITPGAARALETDLTAKGIEYDILASNEVAAAYANLQRAIKDRRVVHVGQPELDFAMANSKSRYLQTGESESFDRREYSVDTSPAVAAAGALYRWGLEDQSIPFIG